MQYYQHWGFQKSPFGDRNQNSFYVTQQHQEAIARLNYLIENNNRLGLFSGNHGIGKTATLHYVQQKLKREGHQCCVLNIAGLDHESFVWQLAMR